MDSFPNFPFLHRDHLKFGREMTIELVIKNKALSNTSSYVKVAVVTREGLQIFPVTLDNSVEMTTQTFKLNDIPIMVSAYDNGDAIEQGECYVSAFLKLNGQAYYTLFSGLVYRGKGISWPTNVIESTIPMPGKIEEYNMANPAAGAEFSYTVPNNRIFLITAISFRLVTAVAAANRRVHLSITYPGGGAVDYFSSIDQAASLTRDYTCAPRPGGLAEFAGTKIIIPIPDNLWLSEGAIIATATDNLQAADDFDFGVIEALTYLGRETP